MSKFELNKILASIILAILLTTIAAKIGYLYSANITEPNQRGYNVMPTEGNNMVIEAEKISIVSQIKELIETASAERGKSVAKRCMSCHSFEAKGAQKIGPNLAGIFGKPKASVQGYKYSKGMQQKGGTWGVEELAEFLENPKTYIDGTKMAFPGLSSAQDIADVIRFLRDNVQ